MDVPYTVYKESKAGLFVCLLCLFFLFVVVVVVPGKSEKVTDK